MGAAGDDLVGVDMGGGIHLLGDRHWPLGPPLEGEPSMTTLQGQSNLIRARLRNDMIVTLRTHLGQSFAPTGPFLDELTEDAMHHVDKVLTENPLWDNAGGTMKVCPSCGEASYLVPGKGQEGMYGQHE